MPSCWPVCFPSKRSSQPLIPPIIDENEDSVEVDELGDGTSVSANFVFLKPGDEGTTVAATRQLQDHGNSRTGANEGTSHRDVENTRFPADVNFDDLGQGISHSETSTSGPVTTVHVGTVQLAGGEEEHTDTILNVTRLRSSESNLEENADDNPAEEEAEVLSLDGHDRHALEEPSGPADTRAENTANTSTQSPPQARNHVADAQGTHAAHIATADEKLVGQDVDAHIGMKVGLSDDGRESYMNRLTAGQEGFGPGSHFSLPVHPLPHIQP
eukprot:3699935-Rhodomonas_salina.3